MTRRCACCGQPFQPRPQVPNQTYCSSAECQRARKLRWQQAKLRADPDYRDNQRDAQRAWFDRHPGYWRAYRAANPDPVEGGRLSPCLLVLLRSSACVVLLGRAGARSPVCPCARDDAATRERARA